MNQSERFFSLEEAQSKIEYWCSYRDRSEYETKQKLYAYHQSEKDILKIIAHLKAFNFLDDARFVHSFVSGKFRIKQWGRKKIYASIMPKGVDKNMVQVALQSIDDSDYRQTLEALLEKKNRLLKNEKDAWKKKQKLLQYAISRGFEYDIVQDVLAKKPL